jgi:tRNA(Met) cytidine acetyltransferase
MNPSGAPHHRRCIVLRGERDATLAEAGRLVSALQSVCVVDASHRSRARSQQLLGRSFDAVVLDLHAGVSADTLGRCHGLVRGGGALLLCMPPEGRSIAAAELAVYPFTAAHVGTRFWSRLERELAGIDTAPPNAPLVQPPPIVAGSAEQANVVTRLARVFEAADPSLIALIAERGRGKSSALGLALRATFERAPHGGKIPRVLVTAPSESAASELLRFAPPRSDHLRFVAAWELLDAAESADLIVVDEAAQLPLPLLQALVARHPRATMAFATTTQGYEGTGRGFVLRFLDWLEKARARPAEQLMLKAPVRWSAGDPLERFVYRLLALDVEVARPSVRAEALAAPRRIERDELARDETLLSSLFALLVHAHYRTTPADLERLLDAPNLDAIAIVEDRRVLGATLVAHEGALPRTDSEALARGEWRIRGHALADTLIVHAGRPDAGELALLRSVRIATHPELRCRGIARALIEHVHASYTPDLFGTIFGATAELLAFRRAAGYSLVRVGSSRGISTGEPPAVLLRARTPRGAALIADLVADLARNLPLQLELLASDGELDLDPELERALQRDLPDPTELDASELQARVQRFASGAQTLEAAVYALSRYLDAHPERLALLDPKERALLEQRVLARRSWRASARAAGFADVPAAMKSARPAFRKILGMAR